MMTITKYMPGSHTYISAIGGLFSRQVLRRLLGDRMGMQSVTVANKLFYCHFYTQCLLYCCRYFDLRDYESSRVDVARPHRLQTLLLNLHLTQYWSERGWQCFERVSHVITYKYINEVNSMQLVSSIAVASSLAGSGCLFKRAPHTYIVGYQSKRIDLRVRLDRSYRLT